MSFSNGYKVLEKKDIEKNYSFFTINYGSKRIAQVCLVDPSRKYEFFSRESDPYFFRDIEKNYFQLTQKYLNQHPAVAILADFSKMSTKKGSSFSFKYFFNYLGVLFFAPSYLKQKEIINPSKEAKRFFVELTINNKDCYGLIVFDNVIHEDKARELIKKTKAFGSDIYLVPVLDYFPLKLVVFHGQEKEILYESHKNHRYYDCLFITGEKKFFEVNY